MGGNCSATNDDVGARRPLRGRLALSPCHAGTGGNYRATQNDGGQGDPFGAASHFLGHYGTGERHDHGI